MSWLTADPKAVQEAWNKLKDIIRPGNPPKIPNKEHILELHFESKDDLKSFIAWWLDGGGEQDFDCETDYATSDKWDKHIPKWLNIINVGNHDEE